MRAGEPKELHGAGVREALPWLPLGGWPGASLGLGLGLDGQVKVPSSKHPRTQLIQRAPPEALMPTQKEELHLANLESSRP